MESSAPPTTIESARLRLVRHTLEQAEAMFELVDRDRERLGRFLPWVEQTKTIEEERGFIRTTLEQWEKGEIFGFGIFLKSGEYVGNIGVHGISRGDRRCEIGYWIGAPGEGKGYMSESVRALERELFGIGFHRIEICCSSLNLRSARVPRACGYRLEGLMREDGADPGGVRDTLVFAKLATDGRDAKLATDGRDANLAADGRNAKPATAGIAGLDSVVLFVESLPRSREWYREALGVAPAIDRPEYCEFRLGGSALGLHPADARSPVSTGGQVAYWNAPDLTATLEHLRARGASVHRGPLELGDGTSVCQVADPFGNVFGLRGRIQ
jgi:RimJ/RimL family protein N-acetyltransferase/predicted enzyme related to lactoylglutathione lyase